MGKYIIELDEDPHNIRLMQLKNGGNGVPVTEFKVVCPYKEPDLEQVKRDYDAFYERGYEQGQKDLREVCAPKDEEAYGIGYNEGFQCGFDLAWEVARKVVGLTTADRRKIFGSEYMYSILEKYAAAEAIEKLKAYEQEQEEMQEEIKVWDEVINEQNFKGTVTGIDIEDDGLLTLFCQDGTWIKSHARFWKKTGRTFPELAAVLEKMREE